MNFISKQLSFIAAALLMFSCSNDIYTDGNEDGNSTSSASFSAKQEQISDGGDCFEPSVTTRTSLSNNSVLWTVGDAINLYDGTANIKFAVTSVEEDDKTTCTFMAQNQGVTDGATNFVALYPYNMAATFGNGKIMNLTLPANQNAVDGGFDPRCNLMVAKETTSTTKELRNTTFQFKHLCSYIKVRTDFDCSRIVITFKDTNAKPAGTFDVSLADMTNPKVDNVVNNADDKNVVRLLGDIKAGVDYYIAVLPGTYSDGFTVMLDPKSSRTMINWTTKTITISPRYRSSSKDLTMQRAYNKSLGVLTSGNTTVDANATVIEFVDLLDYEQYAQDMNHKLVLWAKNNLGAENTYTTGNYYAWGEVASKDSYTYGNYLCKDYYPVSLDLAHDAAAVNYGKGWKIPSDEEFTQLKENTIWKYDTNQRGYYVFPKQEVNGKVVANVQMFADGKLYSVPTGMDQTATEITDTDVIKKVQELSSTNSPYLFLVTGGAFCGDDKEQETTKGAYWTSGRGDSNVYSVRIQGQLTAYYLGFNDTGAFNMKSYWNTRYDGLLIRPVFVVDAGE